MDPRTRDLLIYSVPNSALAGSTPRDRYRMVRAVQEGLLKGMPDICVDEPRGEYHGLRIEMKRDKRNKDGSRPVDVLPSVDQLAIHEKLRANGYAVQVCYGTVDAMKALCNYLGIVPPT